MIVTDDGLLLDSAGSTITGYILESASGILTGEDAVNLGLFQEDTDERISGTFAYQLNGKHLLGDVIGEDVDMDLAADLTLSYTIAEVPGLFTASVVVPEPGTLVLLAAGGIFALLLWRVIAELPELEPPKKEVVVRLEEFLPKVYAGSPAAKPAPKPEPPKAAAQPKAVKKAVAPKPATPKPKPKPKPVVQKPVPKPKPKPRLVPKEITPPRSISMEAPVSPKTPTATERIAQLQATESAAEVAIGAGTSAAAYIWHVSIVGGNPDENWSHDDWAVSESGYCTGVQCSNRF